MDRQYPDYPQYDSRRPWTYHAAAPTTPLSAMYSSTLPARPEPTASASAAPRRPPMRRHSERRSDPRAGSFKRSLPHNGASCGNDLCDSPAIASDERLCPGPNGVDLCSRCYKRFKIERRRAMEDRRAVTDDWRRPRRCRSSLQATPTAAPVALESEIANARGHEQAVPDLASSIGQSRVSSQIEPANVQRGLFASQVGDTTRQPSPLVTPLEPPEKSPSLNSVSSFDGPRSALPSELPERSRRRSPARGAPSHYTQDLESQTQRAPPSPRKHRSQQRGRDDQRRERRSRARDPSTYEEAEYFKYGRMNEKDDCYDDDNGRRGRGCCGQWSRRRKCLVISIATSIILLILIIALAVAIPRRGKGFKYTPSTAQVNNTLAFTTGGATRKSVNDTTVGADVGAGTDSYTYYTGNASNFPPSSAWVSFPDMWTANLETFKQSCGWLDRGDNNSPQMISDIYAAIQDRAAASLVDQRIILATIIQETNGCPLVSHTTSSGGTRNPGLMQSHNGHEYNPKHSRLSIMLMVQDGTQGTEAGWGLVDNLNTYGDPYKAMRGYNSGYIPTSGDLSEAAGATACYVTDVANRLTGWVRAESTCPGDAS